MMTESWAIWAVAYLTPTEGLEDTPEPGSWVVSAIVFGALLVWMYVDMKRGDKRREIERLKERFEESKK